MMDFNIMENGCDLCNVIMGFNYNLLHEYHQPPAVTFGEIFKFQG